MEKEFGDSYCWFCSRPIVNSPKNLSVKMHKVLERKGNKVTYLPLDVLIPRCGKCKSIHLLNNILPYTLGAASCIGLLISPLGKKIDDIINSWGLHILPGILFVLIFSALAIPGVLIAMGLRKLICSGMHVKDNEYHKSHPAYKLAVEQGYMDGKKPS